MAAYRTALAEPAGEPTPEPASCEPPTVLDSAEKPIITRTRRRYAEVQDLIGQGHSRNAISRRLHLDIGTVHRLAEARSVEELVAKSQERVSKIDPFKEHLHRRWNEGATDAAGLAREITALGYTGGPQTVARYLGRFRDGRPAPTPGPIPPTVRETSRWIMTRADRLDADDEVALKGILARCPHLDRLADHVTDFARMMTKLEGSRLEEWITTVEADVLTALTSFATTLRRDLDAVRNGLTLTYSSGAVEGAVCRI